MDFTRGKTSCAEIATDGDIARHMGASAVGGEADAVIAALDVVADDLAGGERRLAVGAAVGEHGDGPVFCAEDHQGLVADRARQRLCTELGGGRGGVPLIAKEWGHACSPSSSARPSYRPRRAGGGAITPAPPRPRGLSRLRARAVPA